MTAWAVVVFGRTATSDSWWRAIPEGLDEHGWLGAVVHSAVSDGHEIGERPRFLLAQNDTHRIVGVACRAAGLSEDMRSVGQRPLFCFVGWAAERSRAAEPRVPRLEDLALRYPQWAGPVYREVMERVWNAPPAVSRLPQRTIPEPVRWAPAPEMRAAAALPAPGPWPQDAWPALWDAANAAAGPVTCVVGWEHMRSARFEEATHIGVADAPARPVPPLEDLGQPAPPAKEDVVQARPADPGGLTRIATRTDRGPVPASPGSSPDAPPAGRPSQPARIPMPAKLAAAGVAGAIIGGIVAAAISGGSGSALSGPPLVAGIVVPAGAGVGDVLRYQAGALSPGQSVARMAAWAPPGAPSGAAACATELSAVAAAASVKARPGLQICVQLAGQPARYGLIAVSTVGTGSVSATATFWP
jgi:hypothetical protein